MEGYDHGASTASSIESDLGREVLGTTLACALILSRLHATVSSGWREMKKNHNISVAQRLLDLQDSNKYSTMFTNHEVAFARSILSTEYLFALDENAVVDGHSPSAARARYTMWSTLALSSTPRYEIPT